MLLVGAWGSLGSSGCDRFQQAVDDRLHGDALGLGTVADEDSMPQGSRSGVLAQTSTGGRSLRSRTLLTRWLPSPANTGSSSISQPEMRVYRRVKN